MTGLDRCGRARRVILLALAVLVVGSGLGFAYVAGWFRGELPNRQAFSDGAADGTFDPATVRVRPTPIALIEPGTIVADRPPEGWTHLIIKTGTRVGAGDVDDLNATVRRLTSFLTTVLLAKVATKQTDGSRQFYLEELGYGFAVDVAGETMVVSSDRHKDLEAGLGVFESIALTKAEERLPEMLIVARGENFAIYDSSTYLRIDDSNQPTVIRHVILVDPTTGDLRSIAWGIKLDNDRYATLVTPLYQLPANFVMDTVMYVDASEFAFGFPTEAALAGSNFGEGMQVHNATDTIAPLLAKQDLTAEDAARLAGQLRHLLWDNTVE